LELLGKHSDVGLFSEKQEVTITHQTTDELKEKLRAKLQRLIKKSPSAQDDEPVTIEMGGEVIDVDVELGLKPADGPVSESKPDVFEPENDGD
jgi:hypothetical protein